MSKAIKRNFDLPAVPSEPDFAAGTPLENSEPMKIDDGYMEFAEQQRESLAKVMTNPQTPRCPFCKSVNLQSLGAATGANAFYNTRCADCRKHFRAGPTELNKIA